jgi:hypothetical protein
MKTVVLLFVNRTEPEINQASQDADGNRPNHSRENCGAVAKGALPLICAEAAADD